MDPKVLEAFEKLSKQRRESTLQYPRAQEQRRPQSDLESKIPLQQALAGAIRAEAIEVATLFVQNEIPADLHLQRTVTRSWLGFRKMTSTPAWILARNSIKRREINSSFDNWTGEVYEASYERKTVITASGELMYVTYGLEEREISDGELVPIASLRSSNHTPQATLQTWQNLYIRRIEQAR